MTVHVKQSTAAKGKRHSTSKIIFSVSATVLLFIFLMRSSRLSEEIFISITETAKKVIPALFPIMVLSRFMTDYGLLDIYEKYSASVTKSIFGVSKKAVGGVILGFLSSFPIGVITICELYKRGELTKEEAESSLGPAHNTGPAFPICLIGTKLYGHTLAGVFLYFTQMLSSVITSKILIKKSNPKSNGSADNTMKNYSNFSTSLTNAICSSAIGCVNITAFVAFGRLITDTFSALVCGNKITMLILTSFIEFSSGSAAAVSAGGIFGFILCSFSISFGGIIALLQAASYTSKVDLSMKYCILYKLLQGLIAALLSIFGYFILF